MEKLVTPNSSFWSGKRVLLTGHTGFKGAWTTLWLEKLGAKVFGLALEPITDPALWNLLGRPLGDASIADIRDRQAVQQVFDAAQPEILIHMAAQALVHPSFERPAETFEVNVMGLANVLDAARNTATVRAIVNVTSDKCYENREQIWSYRETDPMGGSDPYSASKGCAELLTTSYRRSFFNKAGGARLASARAGNVIGGGDWSADRLVPDCVRAFQVGEVLKIRNPLATRPWQHVLEPISGYLLLAEALYEDHPGMAEGWNFGPPDSDVWTVERVANHLTKGWGASATWQCDEKHWPKESMLLRVDATKARVRLNWNSRLNVAEALDWSLDWYKAVARGESAREVTLRQLSEYEARETAT
ncbi:CDP-glucose 4,6-dehydratase [Hyphomicrobium sp. MC1]|uniref:CDP-glucose 4,6-dehydratase n=1 Tax=Hyphomicrobium sp. (strain MC1) TaxID=717785 RepID=UPI000213D81E|nr:cdp-glucose 4,6-dehydratase [Hyphomicrobium sp. MC1]